jgi:hypothetical protein
VTEEGKKVLFKALYGPDLMNVISGTCLNDQGFEAHSNKEGVTYTRKNDKLHFDRRGAHNFINIDTNAAWIDDDDEVDDNETKLKQCPRAMTWRTELANLYIPRNQ